MSDIRAEAATTAVSRFRYFRRTEVAVECERYERKRVEMRAAGGWTKTRSLADTEKAFTGAHSYHLGSVVGRFVHLYCSLG